MVGRTAKHKCDEKTSVFLFFSCVAVVVVCALRYQVRRGIDCTAFVLGKF